jgi:two-component system, chemotaxis family, CheB/CheR fusion protein
MAKKIPTRPKRQPSVQAKPAPQAAHPGPAPCQVVAFGASAGGLEAFSELLQHLPADTGMAFVLIQHLDPRHESLLTELLAKATTMPVAQVTDPMRAEANRVYLLPPNANLTIADGVLHLEPRTTPHMPIDHFFRSLAQDQGSKAIGVILSGTASDGTQGLKAIKAEGGITFAQDERTAKYDGMPRSALMAGCVDFVLPPDSIARELVRLAHHPFTGPSGEKALEGTEKQFEEVLAMLRKTTNVDFAYYKHGTVQRRILRRMAMHSMDGIGQYTSFLKRNPDEIKALFRDILINVTSFFREPGTFDVLRKNVFPQLLRNRRAEDPVRIWVPGCSTGEEAYSVAICLLEYMRENNLESSVQVFGTDLSETVLEKARAGIYPESIAADVSPERLRRFFVKANGGYQISGAIRDMCIFARQNLVKDPPFSKLDLILCRNVLIYLGPPLQTRVMRYFHYGLKPKGFLALGQSESIGAATTLFTPLLAKQKVYAKNSTPPRPGLDLGPVEERTPLDVKDEGWRSGTDLHKRVDQLILARHSPPGVVVDEQLQVIEFRGHTAPFLEHTAGQPSLNLLKMTRGALGLELRGLIQKARKTGSSIMSEPVQLASGSGTRPTRVTVTPIKAMDGSSMAYLLLFELEAGMKAKTSPPAKPGKKHTTGGNRLTELEEELALTKQYLQTVIEEQEAASEELKSAHEEVQSSNEELQSTNEELLTSKEELQSANEELNTVNEEMQSRNSELTQINDDLTNLLSSANIPIVMLGSDLRIRRFTPHAERVLNLLSTDVGRRLTDFRLKIDIPDLESLFLEVIDTLQTKEREVQDQEGRTYLMSIRPYRTLQNRIDGAVMSLYDITDRRQAAEVRYRRLFEASKDGIIIIESKTGDILDVNPFITRLAGHQRTELLGRKISEQRFLEGEAIQRMVDLAEGDTYRAVLPLRGKDGNTVDVEIVANGYVEGPKHVVQLNVRDVSARIQAEEAQRRQEQLRRDSEKMEAVGRLAGGIAHDFNNLVTAVVGYSDLLRMRINDQTALRDLERIREAGERASILTRQLLAFGRKQTTRPAILDLNVVVADMREILNVIVTENITLVVEPGSDIGLIRIDRGQIEQVVTNLVMNARDAMPDGGRITITTGRIHADENSSDRHQSIPPGDYVMLSVADTGTGMDAETQSHLFEPFFTTKPRGLGTGLGLSTISGIVKQSGGHVWAYSQLGQGTTFEVYLPHVEAEAESAAVSSTQAPVPRGSETILLVEDEPLVRRLASTVLQENGYRVLEAANGPEALRLAGSQTGNIDLLLTDVVMPRMSGREAADRLASERRDMKVLFMSGHAEDALSHHGVLDPEFAFLPKPFTPESLSLKVREVLDDHR